MTGRAFRWTSLALSAGLLLLFAAWVASMAPAGGVGEVIGVCITGAVVGFLGAAALFTFQKPTAEKTKVNDDVALYAMKHALDGYAAGRAADVTVGTETPELAALLVQKYGLGLVEATRRLHSVPVAEQLAVEVEKAVAAIDPRWKRNARLRRLMRPATIAKEIIHTRKAAGQS